MRECIQDLLVESHPAKLLVSVRDFAEARLANEWADVVDIKDPSRGPLGAADPSLWADVLRAVTDKQVTLALGEADEWTAQTVPRVPTGVAAVKLGPGPSGDIERVRACRRLFEQAAGRALPWAAVAYADRPFDVDAWLTQTADDGCVAALVDTYDKLGPRITELWTIDQIKEYRERANAVGLPFVLAGRVGRESLPALAAVADVVGLRSAACDAGDRARGMTTEALQKCRQGLRSNAVVGVS